MTDVAGRVNKEQVLKFRPSWEQAIDKGVLCTIFCRELEAACPDLPKFRSRAHPRKETIVQVMQNMHRLVIAQKRKLTGSITAESAPGLIQLIWNWAEQQT